MLSIETRVSKSRVSKSRVLKLEYRNVEYRNVEYRNSSIEKSSIEKSKFENRESIKSAMLHTSLMSFFYNSLVLLKPLKNAKMPQKCKNGQKLAKNGQKRQKMKKSKISIDLW